MIEKASQRRWKRLESGKKSRCIYHKKKNIRLASYIDKKKSGKNNVIVLSTMHDIVKVTNDQRKNPQTHRMYDHMKGGIDVVELLSTSHSTRIESKR